MTPAPATNNPYSRLLRWMYRGGRPSRLAKFLNRISAWQFAAGLAPRFCATLEIPGRRTGRIISFPVVIANYRGERYLVSMLGQEVNWVRNLRAAHGRAVLRGGRRVAVRLREVEVDQRAPILRQYLDRAPGARPHVPVARRAPLSEFEKVAAQYPVFRITQREPEPVDSGPPAE